MEEKSSRKLKEADVCLQKTSGEYTVGWICAISTEYTAAQAALDEEHERPDHMAPGDYNDYTFGHIGQHNVVIAVLPDGEYGIDSAALVARDMLHSFANIKVGLMVGIGGGAPSQRHDIRLGDIVVSTPRDGQSGVLQYDFGKMVQGEPFQPTRLLNQSPRILRAAVNGLKSQYQRKGYGQLGEIIDDILKRNPNLRKDFGRPDLTSDRLYRSEIIHPTNDISIPDCLLSCGGDPSKLIIRSRRVTDESSPIVHYGIIASANTLMKDAVLRDKLALEKNIICFEMEAAGLMNHFPCLVVRGICDYSDSHKNKQWQGYAAIAAAAYAKDLLHRIPLDDIGTLQRVAREDKAQVPSNNQKQALLKSLKFDQHKDRHDNIKAAHADTCKWLQESVEYLDWLDPDKVHDHHGFLWIKGKPGAGKSTIMKFALATARKRMQDRIIISFFFNARGSILEKSTLGMYRSLLLQLLQHIPTLQDKLDLSDFIKNHDTGYRWNVEPLKALFHQAVENIQNSKVVCLIDALDECEHDEVRDMISFFEYLGDLVTSKGIGFLVCFSSRHYPYISIQSGLSLILENQKEHAQDIVKYVRSELKIGRSHIANQIYIDLPSKSRGIFMWVILVVLILNKEYDEGRIYNLQTKYQQIPGDLHELFKEILTRSPDEKLRETLRCLQWILFAEKPLSPKELYFAVLSDVSPTWVHREALEHDIERFVLSSSLGFADIIVSNDYVHKTFQFIPESRCVHGLIEDYPLKIKDYPLKGNGLKVQFIHESVKDFLLKDNGLREIWTDLSGDIHGQGHEELKQCCLKWISMKSTTRLQDSSSEKRMILGQLASPELPFLSYAERSVLYHANAAQKYGISQAEFIQDFEADTWKRVSRFQDGAISSGVRLLYTLAAKNLNHLIGCHPSKLAFSEVGDEHFGTPLFAALANGSNEAIREFLKAQAEITPEFHELYEEYCRKRFDLKAFRGGKFDQKTNILSFYLYSDEGSDILKVAVLLNMRHPYPNLNWEDERSQSPLLYVSSKGNKALLGVLIEKCMSNVKEIPRFSSALLQAAVEKGHGDLVELLLQKGAQIEARSESGQTTLCCAVQGNHKDMAQLLIKAGANTEARNGSGQTPLILATQKGHKDMIVLLLGGGANSEVVMNNEGQTPLVWAIEYGLKDVAIQLIEQGSDVEAMDKNGQTPLMWAMRYGLEDMAIQLLEKGYNIEVMDKNGQTPLMWAIRYGLKDVAAQLLEKGYNIEAMDKNGQTPLMLAIRRRNLGLVRLLLNRGANVTTGKVANIRPREFEFSEEFREKLMANRELTLLEFAQQFEETGIVELLSRNGAT